MNDAVRSARSFRLTSSGRLLTYNSTLRVGPPGAHGNTRHLGTRAKWGVNAYAGERMS
jgi:hypothetical protein